MTFPRTTHLTNIAMTSLLAALFISSPSAMAEETICDGDTVMGSVDEVVIPSGASCALIDVEVDGNVTADGAVSVEILGGKIDGNVRIKNATGNVLIEGAEIDGNVRIEESTADFIEVRESHVDGNITIKNNLAASFGVGPGLPPMSLHIATNNTVNGNIKMRGNEADIVNAGSCGQILPDAEFSNKVEGNITVRGNTGRVIVSQNCNHVDGNISVKDNTVVGVEGDDATPAADLQTDGNTVSGNIQVKNNTAARQISIGDNDLDENDPNDTVLFINIVGGNLICSGNDPTPTTSFFPGPGDPVEEGNIVAGNINCSD